MITKTKLMIVNDRNGISPNRTETQTFYRTETETQYRNYIVVNTWFQSQITTNSIVYS